MAALTLSAGIEDGGDEAVTWLYMYGATPPPYRCRATTEVWLHYLVGPQGQQRVNYQ